MKVRLYINDQLCDLSDDSLILMNYTQEELSNPTAVKNSYSQSVSLPATARNNAVFGHYWRLDTHITSTNYNPLKRADFAIYNERNEVLESGYVKLDSVERTGDAVKAYRCTLFGGLGAFIWSLTYDGNGNKRTLADIDYLGTANPESELDFNIDKDAVADAWDYLAGINGEQDPTTEEAGKMLLYSTGASAISTASGAKVCHYDVTGMRTIEIDGERPSVTTCCMAVAFDTNGNILARYERGDGNGARQFSGYRISLPQNATLVKVHGTSRMAARLVAIGGDRRWGVVNFAPCYNGLPQSFDSDKVVIYKTNVLDTDFPDTHPEDSSFTPLDGYLLCDMGQELDEWRMLDLRSYNQRPVLNIRAAINALCQPRNNGGYEVELDPLFFNSDNPYWANTWMALDLLSNNDNYRSETRNISLTYQGNTLTGEGNTALVTADTLPPGKVAAYITAYLSSVAEADGSLHYFSTHDRWETYLMVQLVAYDLNNRVVGGSPCVCLCSEFAIYNSAKEVAVAAGWSAPYDSYGGMMYGEFEGGAFSQAIPMVCSAYSVDHYAIHFCPINIRVHQVGTQWVTDIANEFKTVSGGVVSDNTARFSGSETDYIVVNTYDSIRSHAHINKALLLTGDTTPADLLLSYVKTFGLYIVKDRSAKKIYIRSRNTQYTGETRDYNKRIDRHGTISKTPVVADAKWYDLAHPVAEGALAKAYNDRYNRDYGSMRIDTGYEFNAEATDLLEGTLFKGAVELRDVSWLYADAVDSSDRAHFNFRQFPLTLTYYKAGETKIYDLPAMVAESRDPWSGVANTDWWPKAQFCGDDGSPVDAYGTLLFLGAPRYPYDNTAPTMHRYRVTDDFSQMYEMTGGKPCWFKAYGGANALTLYNIPQFSRSWRTATLETITEQLDFATPKEIYNDTVENIHENGALYPQGWKAYLADRFSRDTSVVRCKVDLRGEVVGDEMLRRFYFFDDSIWVLNRIIDHSLARTMLTECEFVRVQDKAAYTASQKYKGMTPPVVYTVEVEPTTITFTAVGNTQTITISSNDKWRIDGLPSWITADVTEGGEYDEDTETTVTLTATENPSDSSRTAAFSVRGLSDGESQSVSATQAASVFTYALESISALSFGADGGTATPVVYGITYRNGEQLSREQLTSADGLTLSKGSGDTYNQLTFSGISVKAANLGTTSRSALSVTFTARWNGESKTFTVSQAQNTYTDGAVSGSLSIAKWNTSGNMTANPEGDTATLVSSFSQVRTWGSGASQTIAWGGTPTYTLGTGLTKSGSTITFALNSATTARSATITAKNGTATIATLTVNQAKSVYTYALDTISGSQFGASGGTYTPTIYGITYRNGNQIERTQLTSAAVALTKGSGDSNNQLSISGLTITAANLAKNERTSISVVFTATWQAHSASKTFTILQAANTVSTSVSYADAITLTTSNYGTGATQCPAGGGSATITSSVTRTTTTTKTWTSGSTETTSVEDVITTYKPTASGTGLTLNTAATTATWASRGTTTGNQRTGTITLTTPYATKSITLYQQANVKTETASYDYTIAGLTSPFPSTSKALSRGETKAITYTNCQKYNTPQYSYTSGATGTGTRYLVGSVVPTFSESLSWVSISGSSVTVSAQSKTGTVRSGSINAYAEGVKVGTVSVYQAATVKTYRVVVSAPTGNVSAGGGTKTLTATGYTDYDNGSASDSVAVTSGWTCTNSGTQKATWSVSGNTATAASLGTYPTSGVNSGTFRCTWNGVSASLTVGQARNYETEGTPTKYITIAGQRYDNGATLTIPYTGSTYALGGVYEHNYTYTSGATRTESDGFMFAASGTGFGYNSSTRALTATANSGSARTGTLKMTTGTGALYTELVTVTLSQEAYVKPYDATFTSATYAQIGGKKQFRFALGGITTGLLGKTITCVAYRMNGGVRYDIKSMQFTLPSSGTTYAYTGTAFSATSSVVAGDVIYIEATYDGVLLDTSIATSEL